jgi:hypothetical protein
MSPARRVRRAVSARESGFGYNPEIVCLDLAVPNIKGQVHNIAVAGSGVTGTRRVRGFTIDVDLLTAGAVAWALVYVPEGIPAANLTLNVSDGGQPANFYTLEQHVICQGIAAASVASRTFNGLGGSLASNDTVYILVRNLTENAAEITIICRFAIAFI